MGVDIISTVRIARPVDVVAAYAADPDRAPEWYANISSVAWRTTPPLAVGSVIGFVASFMGRQLSYDYEIVEFEPGARLSMRTRQGPFPMETTYTWAASDGGTIMTIRNVGEPAGFSRLFAPFIRPAMGRANRKDLARLKSMLERNEP